MIDQLISNPLYLLLFGGGGVLSIIVAMLTIFFKNSRKDKENDKFEIENNYRTKIIGNKIRGRIKIRNNKYSNISNNKFTDDD